MCSNYLKSVLVFVVVLFCQLAFSENIADTDPQKEYVFKISVFNKESKKEEAERLYVKEFYDKHDAFIAQHTIKRYAEVYSLTDSLINFFRENRWRRTSLNGEYRISSSIPVKAILFVSPLDYANLLIEIQDRKYSYSGQMVVHRLEDVVLYGNLKPKYERYNGCTLGSGVTYMYYEFPKKLVNKKHLVKTNPFVIDSQSGDTLFKMPSVYFEGEAYKGKRIRKGLQYSDGIIVKDIHPVKNEKFSIQIPYEFHAPECSFYYLNAEISVMNGKKTIFSDNYSSSRLRFMPFKMIDYPMDSGEMELTDEFFERPSEVIMQSEKGKGIHVLTPDEVVEYYFARKQSILSGTIPLSNGDLYQLYSKIDDEAELDLITEVAYKKMIQDKDYVKYNKMALYIANRKAMINLKKGIYDLSVLEPFVDVSMSRLNILIYNFDIDSYYIINKPEIIVNQLYTYMGLGMYESADRLCCLLYNNNEGRRTCDIFEAITTINENKVRDFLIPIGDNKAVIYTELPYYDNNNEATSLVDAMNDDNSKKWYLKAILAARDEEKYPTTNGTPLYITYLQRCFKLDSKYKEYYTFDAQFSDKLRALNPNVD